MTDARRTFVLWTVVLAPPLVWLMSFEAIFALAPWACIFQTKLTLYFVSILALLLEVATGWMAWTQWKALGAEPPGDDAGPLPRARIMSISGIVFGVGFALVVIAQAIPSVVLGACE